MAISKTFYQTIELSVVPFDMVRSRTSVDRFFVTADLKMVMSVSGGRVPAQTTIPGDAEGGTIRFTESAIDHQLNGQIFV